MEPAHQSRPRNSRASAQNPGCPGRSRIWALQPIPDGRLGSILSMESSSCVWEGREMWKSFPDPAGAGRSHQIPTVRSGVKTQFQGFQSSFYFGGSMEETPSHRSCQACNPQHSPSAAGLTFVSWFSLSSRQRCSTSTKYLLSSPKFSALDETGAQSRSALTGFSKAVPFRFG